MNDILWEERMTLLPSQCLPPSLPYLKSRGSWRGGGVEGGGGGEQRYKDDALVAGGWGEPRESRLQTRRGAGMQSGNRCLSGNKRAL